MGELGTWLIRAREGKGLTLEDAERDTRISRRYLHALETEQFEVIPAPVYARGFLRSYSQYLGLDPAEMLALFPRDEDEPAPVQPGHAAPTTDNPISPKSPSRPSWRTPQAGRQQGGAQRQPQQNPAPRTQPMPKRPAAGRGVQPAQSGQLAHDIPPQAAPRQQRPRPRQDADEYVIGGGPAPAQQATREPTIGVDIGVPVPARRIKQDPQAGARGMLMLGVAAGVIVAIIAVALIISRMGGDAEPGGTTPDTAASASQTAAALADATTESSGIPVQRGIVPNVTGLQAETARKALDEAGFSVRETPIRSQEAKGQVTDQAPAAGVQQPEGSEVVIVVSEGPQ